MRANVNLPINKDGEIPLNSNLDLNVGIKKKIEIDESMKEFYKQ